jgi:hypothetical protein
LGAWVSGLMVSRLADEAAIFDGVCMGAYASPKRRCDRRTGIVVHAKATWANLGGRSGGSTVGSD